MRDGHDEKDRLTRVASHRVSPLYQIFFPKKNPKLVAVKLGIAHSGVNSDATYGEVVQPLFSSKVAVLLVRTFIAMSTTQSFFIRDNCIEGRDCFFLGSSARAWP